MNIPPIKLEHEGFGFTFNQATAVFWATDYHFLSKRLGLSSLKYPSFPRNVCHSWTVISYLFPQKNFLFSSITSNNTRHVMADEEHARKYGKYIKGQGEDDKRGIGHKDPPSYTEDIRDDAVGSDYQLFYLKKQTDGLCASSRRKC